MPTILVVDDEAHLREVVQYALEKEGFTVELRRGRRRGAAPGRAPAASTWCVLDIMMPEIDGLEVCRRLRAKGPIPIIFLSSRGEEVDRIVGLELGGDDYLAKPFSPARAGRPGQAVLRRAASGRRRGRAGRGHAAGGRTGDGRGPVELDHGRVEPPPASTCVDGQNVDLTVTEFRVLQRPAASGPGRS